MEKLIKKPTQCDKVLKVLEENNGEWVSGQHFLHNMYLSQYHARIWDLINKKGIKIETSDFTDNFGFKSYRLPIKETLF